MTFCLGMKVAGGLVGIADTRVTSGTARITARKVTVHQHGRHSIFLMTSGLRSVRDKALTYFDQMRVDNSEKYTHLYELVNAVARQIRRVADEDQAALEKAGVRFNLHALVGGQLEKDTEHRLFMIYPEGNWVEVGTATPYYIIGESGYGRPILERTLSYESTLDMALRVGFLAFNATIRCAIDVDYPIDVVMYKRGTYDIVTERFDESELKQASKQWQRLLGDAVNAMDVGWMDKILRHLPT